MAYYTTFKFTWACNNCSISKVAIYHAKSSKDYKQLLKKSNKEETCWECGNLFQIIVYSKWKDEWSPTRVPPSKQMEVLNAEKI